MPRQLRIEYPGAIYHVMSRGDRREDIFYDDVDRHDFVRTLAEACQKTGFEVHAYCLMPNHFHLVVETPNGKPRGGHALAAQQLQPAFESSAEAFWACVQCSRI